MDYFADNGKIFLNDEVINTDARKSVVAFEPLGVVGSIMPWNFPYWQALRFGAPSQHYRTKTGKCDYGMRNGN